MKSIVIAIVFFICSYSAFSQNEAGPDKTICKGASVGIGGPNNGYCYIWDPVPGLTVRNTSNLTVSPASTTTYKLTIIGPDLTFTRTDDVTVTVIETNDFDPNHVSVTMVAASFKPILDTVGNCIMGLSYPESVDVQISACSDGSTWHAVLLQLNGNYSKQVKLLPSIMEVTGIGGNTNQSNFCKQVSDLKFPDCDIEWYISSAVSAHEDEHIKHFEPALKAMAYPIKIRIENLTVPDTGQSLGEATQQIKLLQAYTAELENARIDWLAEILVETQHDHDQCDANGNCGAAISAEQAEATKVIATICKYAKENSWRVCSICN